LRKSALICGSSDFSLPLCVRFSFALIRASYLRPFAVAIRDASETEELGTVPDVNRLSTALGAYELHLSLFTCHLSPSSLCGSHLIAMRFLSLLVMALAGFFLSIQGPVNGRLRLALESPVFAAAISFISGAFVLLCLMTTGAFGGIGTGLRGLQSAPPWAYLGGVLGIGAIIAIPNVGVVVAVCAAIAGQMIGSSLADTFGWFGVTKVPLDPLRLVGIGLLLVGVLLVQRK
jgi:bacterial/archaeal transporter family-2 protein